jgi:hypothetical protein
MFRKLSFSLLLFSIANLTIYSEEKVPAETKAIEPEKKPMEEPKVSDEKEKQNIASKEQEKKALENVQGFFKILKGKNNVNAKKFLSVPFIFEDGILFSKKDLDKLVTTLVTDFENDDHEFTFSICTQKEDFTENNIIITMKEKEAEDKDLIFVWLDRDSLKIIGFFTKEEPEDENESDEETHTKMKPIKEPEQKKAVEPAEEK